MKRALAVFFTLALLSVSLLTAAAGASSSPTTQGANGNGYGACNGPLNSTHNSNSGNHDGGYYYCYPY
jgi:hypothetical protein